MVKLIDVVEGKKFKRELYNNPLEEYMITSYSKIDTVATGSYNGPRKW